MEIEKQRGISVASRRDAGGLPRCVINLLDTPRPRDFSKTRIDC
jgi:peptide subunit release factor RF-3